MFIARRIPTISTLLFSKLAPTTFIFNHKNCYNFTNYNSNITTPSALNKFSNLLLSTSQQSLTEAAEMMAQLQVKFQLLQQQIQQMQTQLDQLPSNTRILVQKIQRVLSNIQLQDQQLLNIEKRTQKEINDCKSYSISNVAKQMLDIADSMQKCYKHAQDIHKDQQNKEVKTLKQLSVNIEQIFEVYGIKQFDPLGQLYDPNKQQAIAHVPLHDDKKSNTVAFTMRTGYMIKGRLLRSAHVGVYQ